MTPHPGRKSPYGRHEVLHRSLHRFRLARWAAEAISQFLEGAPRAVVDSTLTIVQ